MISITYCKEGISFGDWDLISNAKIILNNENAEIKVSTANIILAVRLLCQRKKIRYVQFLFNDKIITLNEDFTFSENPEGFCDTSRLLLYEIIDNRRDNKCSSRYEKIYK